MPGIIANEKSLFKEPYDEWFADILLSKFNTGTVSDEILRRKFPVMSGFWEKVNQVIDAELERRKQLDT